MLLLSILVIIILLSIAQIIIMWLPKKKDVFYDGRKPTKREAENSHKEVIGLVEQFPEGQFSKDHPEYLEEIIENVDISEIDDILKK